MAVQTPPIGRLHQLLAGEFQTGMNRVRAQVLSYVEMLGLPPTQEAAFKTTVKNATTGFWTHYEQVLKDTIQGFAEVEPEPTLNKDPK